MVSGDGTGTNTNTGFDARKLLTQAAADDALNTGGEDVNVIIPLNRYSFFEELNDKMLVPMQLQFNIELNSDDELIHKANAANDGRIVLNRFLLWIPKLTPKDSLYDKFVTEFLKETQWTYMREFMKFRPLLEQISASIDNVKHIFIYLKKKLQKRKQH